MKSPTHHILRSTAICTAVLASVLVLISTVLPWLANSGYAGEVIQFSYQNQRDATPLFYSESDRTWELLDQIETREGAE